MRKKLSETKIILDCFCLDNIKFISVNTVCMQFRTMDFFSTMLEVTDYLTSLTSQRIRPLTTIGPVKVEFGSSSYVYDYYSLYSNGTTTSTTTQWSSSSDAVVS